MYYIYLLKIWAFLILPWLVDSYTNPPRGGPSIDAIPRNKTSNPNVDVSESMPKRSTRTNKKGTHIKLKIHTDQIIIMKNNTLKGGLKSV